ncbi:unnamed protein product [Cylicocyclus nassatus]|uniref:AB hydrolase-1 domain-containing protein n=1 Tax=Cylicocyclus nassatus TaxID=53992 RepID=A0AA36GQN2_CYLNA|nr:unnamed protein product [Cylicocyclus nassatus]
MLLIGTRCALQCIPSGFQNRDDARYKEERCKAGRELCGDVHSEATKKTDSTLGNVCLRGEDYAEVYKDLHSADRLQVGERESCPAHDRIWSETRDQRSKIFRTLTRSFNVVFGFLYILCPPWPPWVIHKIAFRAPPRGEYYFLVGGKQGNRRTFFTAKEAEGNENLQICLPHLLKKNVKALDIYYHILRCKPVILKLYDNVRICIMEVMCEQTEKWLRRRSSTRSRSPKLIIFAQPNSSDMGCCMLMDPNFADIADFLRCDMLVFDYVGYGVSDGEATEKTVYDSVERVYSYATENLGYAPCDIALIGFSLGTAAMVHIASKTPDLGAMVLIAPFMSLWRVILRRPNLQPSVDMFPNYEKALNIHCPTLVCHGKDDAIVDQQHASHQASIILLNFWHSNHVQGIFCERTMWDDVERFLEEKMNVAESWLHAMEDTCSCTSHETY